MRIRAFLATFIKLDACPLEIPSSKETPNLVNIDFCLSDAGSALHGVSLRPHELLVFCQSGPSGPSGHLKSNIHLVNILSSVSLFTKLKITRTTGTTKTIPKYFDLVYITFQSFSTFF